MAYGLSSARTSNAPERVLGRQRAVPPNQRLQRSGAWGSGVVGLVS